LNISGLKSQGKKILQNGSFLAWLNQKETERGTKEENGIKDERTQITNQERRG